MQRLQINVGLDHRDTSGALAPNGCCYSFEIHQDPKADLHVQHVKPSWMESA